MRLAVSAGTLSYARSAGDYRVDVTAVGFCFSCVGELML